MNTIKFSYDRHGKRNKDNFEQQQLFVLDFDNKAQS